jgi:hypothetical protein
MNKQVSGIQSSLSLQQSQNLYISLSLSRIQITPCVQSDTNFTSTPLKVVSATSGVRHWDWCRQLHEYATEAGVGNFTSTPLRLVLAEDVLESLKRLQNWIFQPPEIRGGD